MHCQLGWSKSHTGLKANNYEVIIAVDGLEAVAQIRRHMPDPILLAKAFLQKPVDHLQLVRVIAKALGENGNTSPEIYDLEFRENNEHF